MVKQIFQGKIITVNDGKEPICNQTNFDVVIVPQASIAGQLKQKYVQYRDLIDKDEGFTLYQLFVEECNKFINKDGCHVIAGTYGNRQGLKFESDGPYCHTFEL